MVCSSDWHIFDKNLVALLHLFVLLSFLRADDLLWLNLFRLHIFSFKKESGSLHYEHLTCLFLSFILCMVLSRWKGCHVTYSSDFCSVF